MGIMVRVNVTTLKAEPSHYLELVEAGEQVMVTLHGREIAKISPAHAVIVNPIQWGDFIKKHLLIKTKTKGTDAAALIRTIRDEE